MSTFFYMLLAFVVGVLVGWFIWGRLRGELASLRGDLDRANSERDRFRADTDRLSGELDACGRARADLERRLRGKSSKASADKAAAPAPAALMSTPAAAKSSPAKSSAAKSASTKTAAARKPPAAKTATAPKASAAPSKAAPAPKNAAAPAAPDGKADDLRRLIGIGPVNERLLKDQGITTYAQIAAWTETDVKRIEEVLNFDGRIAREKWIEQAKLLAAHDEAEFARRFPAAGTASNT